MDGDRPVRVAAEPPRVLCPAQDRGGQRACEVLTTFRPVEAFPDQRSPRPLDLDPERGEGGPPALGDREPVPVADQAVADEPVPQRDAQLPGEMVVAGAGVGQSTSTHALPEPTRRLGPGEVGEPLDDVGDPRT